MKFHFSSIVNFAMVGISSGNRSAIIVLSVKDSYHSEIGNYRSYTFDIF